MDSFNIDDFMGSSGDIDKDYLSGMSVAELAITYDQSEEEIYNRVKDYDD